MRERLPPSFNGGNSSLHRSAAMKGPPPIFVVIFLSSSCLIFLFVFTGYYAFGPSDVKKCCPFGKLLDMDDLACVPGVQEDPPGIHLVFQPIEGEMRPLFDWDEYSVEYASGTLHYNNHTTKEFCVDKDLDGNITVLVRDEDTPEAYRFYSLGMFISVPFLVATFVATYFLEGMKNFHGECVKRNVLTLSIGYFGLALLQNIEPEIGVFCYVVGYAIQFFFMATFFWLNVMCFDIYWAFSGLRNLTGSAKERERKKLIVYSIYAWCSPLLILVITVAVDFSPSVPINSFFKPRVGENKCFFKENGATWIYFYLPMALIILSNIILFGITAFRIWSHRRETAVLQRGDSRKHDSTNDKERFTLYLKLFIVMGINWVMELLSSVAGGPAYLWYISDFTNTLQGLFIFLIFVWKKRVRRMVWSKIRSCCGKETISSGPRTWSGASSRNTNSTNSSHTINTSIRMNPTTHDPQTTLA